MQSTVITNDQRSRQEFKDRLREKLTSLETSSVDEGLNELVILTVKVPINFSSLTADHLYRTVQELNNLTPEQTTELCEVLQGRESKTDFSIYLESLIEQRVVEEDLPEIKRIQVALPHYFKSLKVFDQYLVLTKELSLAPDEANDVIDILRGKAPLTTNTFDISIEES